MNFFIFVWLKVTLSRIYCVTLFSIVCTCVSYYKNNNCYTHVYRKSYYNIINNYNNINFVHNSDKNVMCVRLCDKPMTR